MLPSDNTTATPSLATGDGLPGLEVGAAASRWSASAVAVWAGYTASLVLAIATLTRSFTATADFAVRVGAATPGWDAYLVPISVDVGILAGSIMAWASTRHGDGERNRWAYGLFAFAATTSVLLNIAHAPLPPTAPEGLDPLAAAEHLRTATAAAADTGSRMAAKFIAGLPPLLLLWITEVLLRHASATTATASADSRPDITVDSRPGTRPASATASPAWPDTTSAATARADMTAGGSSLAGRPASVDGAADAPDSVTTVVAAYLSGGGDVADAELTAAVAEQLGVSERTARRRLEPYRSPREPAAAPRALSVVTDPRSDVEEALR